MKDSSSPFNDWNFTLFLLFLYLSLVVGIPKKEILWILFCKQRVLIDAKSASKVDFNQSKIRDDSLSMRINVFANSLEFPTERKVQHTDEPGAI